MKLFDRLTHRPLLTFGVLLAAFLAWVAADVSGPPPAANPPPAPQGIGDVGRQRAVGSALHQIREGMSRAEVEAELGRPSPGDVRPVQRSNGRVVYRTHYLAYLTTPLAGVQGYCEAILEYDAAAAGHPLLRVTAVPRGDPVPMRAATVA